MSYLPKSKFGDCALCGATNVNCVKVKKELHCIPCHRGNKTSVQIQKANERDRQRAEAVKSLKPKAKRELKRGVASSVRSLSDTPQNQDTLTKSKLLKLADAAFARFIRTRDTHNGKILCPCCNKLFDADAVDKDGVKIANCMHFINRNVYSYRFREDFAAAGHSGCNRNQHLNPTGIEYQNFKRHLMNTLVLGEQEIAEAETAHRKINKLEIVVLKNVIEYYSQQLN